MFNGEKSLLGAKMMMMIRCNGARDFTMPCSASCKDDDYIREERKKKKGRTRDRGLAGYPTFISYSAIGCTQLLPSLRED